MPDLQGKGRTEGIQAHNHFSIKRKGIIFGFIVLCALICGVWILSALSIISPSVATTLTCIFTFLGVVTPLVQSLLSHINEMEKSGTTSSEVPSLSNEGTSEDKFLATSPSHLHARGALITHPPETVLSTISSLPGDISILPGNATFLFNTPLTHPHEYYGRVRERTTLIDRTRKGASTSIVGPRKIGKTWLLSYLQLVASHELGRNFYICYVDASVPSCRTITGFTSRVLEELKLPTTQAKLGLARLEKVTRELKASNIVPVICIDEFEGFANKQEFDLDFFAGLRAITQLGLVLITVSKISLLKVVVNMLGEDARTSPFFNVFEQITLKPFNKDEANSFVEQKGHQVNFTKEERDILLQYGKEPSNVALWSPLRMQLTGKMLLDDKTHHYYHPDEAEYWKRFVDELEEKYRGVVH